MSCHTSKRNILGAATD